MSLLLGWMDVVVCVECGMKILLRVVVIELGVLFCLVSSVVMVSFLC